MYAGVEENHLFITATKMGRNVHYSLLILASVSPICDLIDLMQRVGVRKSMNAVPTKLLNTKKAKPGI